MGTHPSSGPAAREEGTGGRAGLGQTEGWPIGNPALGRQALRDTWWRKGLGVTCGESAAPWKSALGTGVWKSRGLGVLGVEEPTWGCENDVSASCRGGGGREPRGAHEGGWGSGTGNPGDQQGGCPLQSPHPAPHLCLPTSCGPAPQAQSPALLHSALLAPGPSCWGSRSGGHFPDHRAAPQLRDHLLGGWGALPSAFKQAPMPAYPMVLKTIINTLRKHLLTLFF